MTLRRTLLWATPVLFEATQAAAQQKAIEELTGYVSTPNFSRFADFLSRNLDRVIGLKVAVSPSGEERGLQASVSDGQFVTYVPSDGSSSFEIVANSGYRYEHGAYVFDGFFLVKSGGMHQGVISLGLEVVNEAQVRLNSRMPIRRVDLR